MKTKIKELREKIRAKINAIREASNKEIKAKYDEIHQLKLNTDKIVAELFANLEQAEDRIYKEKEVQK